MNNLVYFSVNLQKRYALFPFQNNISFVEKNISLLSFSSCKKYYFRSLDTANCKKAHQKFKCKFFSGVWKEPELN